MKAVQRWLAVSIAAMVCAGAGLTAAAPAHAIPPTRIEERDPPEPPAPPTLIPPDVALQFSPRLVDAQRNAVQTAIQGTLGAADVRSLPLTGSERFGIWFTPDTSALHAARDRGVQQVSLLHAGETFACSISASEIRRRAFQVWNNLPKRLDDDGRPDPDGDIHLTSFAVSFESPRRVVTRVGGWYDSIWPLPNADFVVTLAETLVPQGGAIQCLTSRSVDVDAGWLTFLVGEVNVPGNVVGAGCQVAQVFPRQLLIPGGLRVEINYERVDVSTAGIVAGGEWELFLRNPRVAIQGPVDIHVKEGNASVARSYSFSTTDMRGPLQNQWTSAGTVASPTAATTSVRFNLGTAQVGQVLTRNVAVRVTDADGLQAQAQITVRIHIDPDLDDVPDPHHGHPLP